MTDKRKKRAGIRVNTPSVKTAVKAKVKAETKPKTPKVIKTIVEETATAETTETATNE